MTTTPEQLPDVWNRDEAEVKRHEALLLRISELMDKDPKLGSTESNELELLANAVDLYETKCVELSTQASQLLSEVEETLRNYGGCSDVCATHGGSGVSSKSRVTQ